MRSAVAAFALAVAAAAASWHAGLWRLPDRHDPFAPPSIAEAPGWTTRLRLARAAADPQACRAALEGAGWRIVALPDRQGYDGCGLTGAVRVDGTRLRVATPFVLSCPAALSLAMWETHVLVPAIERRLGRRPVRLEHFGSHACRDVRGAPGVRSRHATADAIDLAAIVLDDGRRVSVARHWRGDGPEASLLRELHRGACRWFDAVLGPDHDAAHADHLHLDRGPWRACR